MTIFVTVLCDSALQVSYKNCVCILKKIALTLLYLLYLFIDPSYYFRLPLYIPTQYIVIHVISGLHQSIECLCFKVIM